MALPYSYENEAFAVATMHGKERALARPWQRWLGARVVVAVGIDTDRFGTFTGDVVRQGSMLDAARAKARAAIESTGLALGIGSEGSFGPHPALPLIAAGTEVLLVLDRKRGLEFHETLVTVRTNFQSRVCTPGDDIGDFLDRVGFPWHAVVAAPNAAAPGAATVRGLTTLTELAAAIARAAAVSRDGRAQVTTDMRAHLNPTRMAVIRALSSRLAKRLATPCPACAVPGFGAVDVVRGLPCGWCGEPTRLVVAVLRTCAMCGFQSRSPAMRAGQVADPGQCQRCNP